jgi:hypothetical protein
MATEEKFHFLRLPPRLMPSSETCIKIAKALKEFDGEE